MHLAGKIALVTGASRGIGRAIALNLAASGAFVFINYNVNEDAARQTLALVETTAGGGALVRCDVAVFAAAQEMVKAIVTERNRLDILVNNAGIAIDGLIARIKEQDWDRMMDTNLKGTFNCCRAATRQMMRQRFGRIVNMTSVVGQGGNAGQVGYASSKAGIIGLTKALAKELGSRNICVNAVAPGFVETDMTRSLTSDDRKKAEEQIPLGRIGTSDDVAAAVAFLVSEDASYITGQVIGVNGGLYM